MVCAVYTNLSLSILIVFDRQRVKIPILLLKSGDIPEFIRISGLNTYEELQEIIQMEKLKAAENQEEL